MKATLVSIIHIQCTRVCGLNSCKVLHHRLLHSDQPYLPHGGDKTAGASLKCGQPPPSVMKSQESDESIVKAGSSREGDKDNIGLKTRSLL